MNFFLYSIHERTGGFLDLIFCVVELLNIGDGREYKKSSEPSLCLEMEKLMPQKQAVESVMGPGLTQTSAPLQSLLSPLPPLPTVVQVTFHYVSEHFTTHISKLDYVIILGI